MGMIDTSIRLNDFMSKPLSTLIANIDRTIKKNEELKKSVAKTVNTASVTQMSKQISELSTGISRAGGDADLFGISRSYAVTQKAQSDIVKKQGEIRRGQENITKATEQSRRKQEEHNNSIEKGSVATSNLTSKVLRLAGAYAGIRLAGAILNASDEMTSTYARLDMINDGLQTTKKLQEDVFKSAQRTGTLYSDVAATVSKLGILAGEAFNGNNKEMLAFAEQMNKQFAIGGASIQEQKAAMYQLTQAMAAGKLQGDEFRSIIENAPLLAEKIAEKMGKSKAELKELSSQGKITANIIKAAMLDSAEETDKAFKKLPLTWGRLKNMMINSFMMASRPLLKAISWVINHWEMLRPVVIALTVALSTYVGVLLVHNAVESISNGLKAISAARSARKAGATLMEAAATTTATGAQIGLNAAILACPVTWILIAIAAIITALYTVVAMVNKVKGTSVSATGIIGASFMHLAASIVNNFILPQYRIFAMFANFLMNVFKHPVSSIKILFLDMAKHVINLIKGIAESIESLINKIPGMKVNMTSGINSWYKKINGVSSKIKKESGYKTYFKDMQNLNYTAMMDKGYKGGKWLAGFVKEKFNPSGSGMDLTGVKPSAVAIANNTDKTAKNTKNIKDAIDLSNERLKFLKNLAERDNINRFTTAKVNLDFSGMQNVLKNDTDIDGFLNKLKETIREGIEAGAEGVHI